MRRRELLGMVASAPVWAAATKIEKVRVRKTGKVENLFKSPGPQPNGLQATPEGLWIMDQGNNKVYLVAYADGKALREFDTEADRASGITFDGEALWMASTYNRQIIRCDANTGKTISRHFTPGAGVIYPMIGDAPGRSSPLARKQATPPAAARPAPISPTAAGTGAHGLEWRAGKLWVAVPPSRMIYRIDPEAWVVEKQFPAAGNRPHGIGWEGKYLWETDSNLNAFFKHDIETGEIVERIQLSDSDPLPHGMTIRDGHLWYCDDVGVICRLKM